MPEYLAPGVYVDETSFRARSIEGVSTSTAAFVGPTLTGPVGGTPDQLTSFADYERIFGGVGDLACSDATTALLKRNYLAHAVRSFFDNGGGRLYVIRVAEGGTAAKSADIAISSALKARFKARFPGSTLNGAQVRTRQDALPISAAGMANAPDGSFVRPVAAAPAPTPPPPAPAPTPPPPAPAPTPAPPPPAPAPTPAPPAPTPAPPAPAPAAPSGEVFVRDGTGWKKRASDGKLTAIDEQALKSIKGELVTLTVTVTLADGSDLVRYEGLGFSDRHPNYVGATLAVKPSRRSDDLTNPIALEFDAGTVDFFELATALKTDEPFVLGDGTDGNLPGNTKYAEGFQLLRALMDVAIVAAPGYSSRDDTAREAIQDALITHVDDPRLYRVGILDAPPDQTPSQMIAVRGKVDSKRAALYYPWVVVANPLAAPSNNQPAEISLPPSGFICGVIARNDVERGVFKAPANEIVRGALRFERNVNYAEQELLNPIGVNCLRLMPGRGNRVWGARTISSDPEWKFVNVRRYFNYVEASIDRSTQWAVFEPNGELLWASVRTAVENFLKTEWSNGALLGTKPEEAFFVRCDRTTMTQNDLDNGRMICLVGIAVVKPAEFVIFRIGQKTADAKN